MNLVAQARPRRAEPRHRQARAPGARRDREAARGAASRWSRSRPGRRSWTRWWPRSTARRRGRAQRRGEDACAASSRRPPGVVDVHDSMEAERDRVLVSLDREKAGLKGIPAAAAVETLAGPGRRPRRRPDRRARLARAGAGARPPLAPPTARAASAASSLRVDSPDGRPGLDRRARARRARAGAAAARAQGPEAGRLRDGRPRRGEGEPGLRDRSPSTRSSTR